MDELNLADDLSYSSSARYDDSDSDADSDIPTKHSLSRFVGLKGFTRTSSLYHSGTSLNKKKKKVQYTNRVQVNLKDPCAFLVITNDLENHQLFCVHSYVAGIHAVKNDITKFTDGVNCAICHQQNVLINALF